MSIYIHGMDMPTKENTVILISPYGDVWMIGDMPNEDTHLAKAKAVSVSAHGRLIDADVLLKGCERVTTEYATREFAFSQTAIENAPTIISGDKEE